ncbi:MAG: hypothetical protein QG589_611 [Patescibacteria group bacterium]|jgi:undecaprenyl-diphosphatase|nr:hypothetical protein [Patescibacteria group bacterium]
MLYDKAMNSFDAIVFQYFAHIRTIQVTEFMYIVSTFFDFSVYSIVVLFCIAILIYLTRGRKYAYLFLSTMSAGALILYVLKNICNVQRPVFEVVSAFGQSFPSYHAGIVTILSGMLMYIYDSTLSRVWRNICNILCVALIMVVSISRLYLGVHWFSDVIGGILIGALISWCAVQIFKRY